MRVGIVLAVATLCGVAPAITMAEEPKSAHQLREKLRVFDRAASDERADITVITGSGFSGQQCKDKRVAPVKEVAERYTRLRAKALAAFDKRELLPLRDWLDENLPASAPPEDTALRVCAKGIPVVSAETVDDLWSLLRSKTQQIERKPSLVISLAVISTPKSDAPFSFKPLRSDDNLFEDHTDATLSRVYRGIYRVTVELEGYKAVTLQKVNLVDATEDSLQCRLIPNDSPGRSTCGLRNKRP